MADAPIHDFKRGQAIYKSIDFGFASAFEGRRYSVTHQTPSTDVTGQTSFVATTPTFLFYQSAADTAFVLNSMQLSQSGTVAGDDVFISLAIDSTSRFSSGGTAVTPQGMYSGESTSANVTFCYNPTASAAGSGTRYLGTWAANADTGVITSIDFHDAVIIGATGSILVYTWAATTGPSWKFLFEFVEFTI